MFHGLGHVLPPFQELFLLICIAKGPPLTEMPITTISLMKALYAVTLQIY